MRRRYQVLALVVGLAMLAAACGDSGGDTASTTSAAEGTATTATTAATTTTGGDSGSTATTGGDAAMVQTPCGEGTGEEATGEPIVVGAVVGATGPADFSSASRSAAAYFKCVNANGGINGRPVEYLVKDDGWDPEAASTAARELVEDKNVVAMIASTSFVECGVNAQYYEDQNVAVIAGVGVPRECFFSRNIAPTNEGPRLSGIGAAQFALEQNPDMKTLACLANSIPNFGGWVCEGVTAWGKANGVEVSTYLSAPDGSDLETVVLQAIGDDPDAAVTIDPAPAMIGYLKIAEQQQDDRPWYGATSAYDLAFPDAVGPYWVGKYHAEIELSPLDSTGPDNTNWIALMDEYGNSDDPRDSFSQAGFVAAKIFVDTLKGMDPANITRETVTPALIGVQDFETDILCRPWYFGEADQHNANHTGRVVELTDEGIGWKTVKDCFDIEDPELDPIYAAEGS